MMYKIETHLHTCHSSPCGKVDADTIVRLYAEAGFHGIIATDHYFHYTCRPHCWNIPYSEFFKLFLEGYHQLCKAAEPYGLKIYKGAEVRFDESTNDYLMYNFPDSLLQDPEAVFAMGVEKFSPLCRESGALLIQAHPFRSKCTVVDPKFVDGYEVKNANPRATNNNELTAEFLAQHPNKLQLCGSDFHWPEDVGCGGIKIDFLPENEEALVQILRSGAYSLL
jgi:predicted metal-dependent phosphoesterase TrpH